MNTMSYKDYIGTVNYSDEDEVFFGKIFGINDTVTFEGTSVGELKQAFREAVDDYLATCLELHKTPDKPFKGSFNVRVSPELHKNAAKEAANQSMTLNELVNVALENFLHQATAGPTQLANAGSKHKRRLVTKVK
jgi:predicted HicB family RNase H-like nuclease